ncbi:hypothetical protein [Halosegnis sp.]|uniref:hypothetical protein n=1 Tax=Halosegnis sp. TaxID=2864959 RepID=UPI0035D4BEA4
MMNRRDLLRRVAPALSGGVFCGVATNAGPWLTDGSTDGGVRSLAETGEKSAAIADTSETSGETAAKDALVTVEEFEEEFTLGPGDRRTWSFQFSAETTLTYDLVVRWGPAQPGADLIAFGSTEEFRAYLDDRRARYLSEGSIFGKLNLDVVNYTVPPGTYHLVADNTDWIKGFTDTADDETTTPDDTTEVPNGSPPNDSSDGSAALGIDFEFTAEQ